MFASNLLVEHFSQQVTTQLFWKELILWALVLQHAMHMEACHKHHNKKVENAAQMMIVMKVNAAEEFYSIPILL